MPHLRLNGITHQPRHLVISTFSDLVSQLGGFVFDFQMFSNTAIRLNFELPCARLLELPSLLTTTLSFDADSQCALGSQILVPQKAEARVEGIMFITFIHSNPDLRIEAPPVPG